MICLRNLMKSYPDGVGQRVPILNVPCLQIHAGQQVAFMGPSGSGKSTLLHIIGGVIDFDEGEVIVAGQSLGTLHPVEKDQLRAKKIGYIFQDFHLLPGLTAEENVLLALPSSIGKAMQETLFIEWFQRVGLSEKRNVYPAMLSRGQQQRIALVRAFIHQPPILLADEPTGSLDRETADEMMDLMLEVATEMNATFLCVTHDEQLAKRFPTVLHIEDIQQQKAVEV